MVVVGGWAETSSVESYVLCRLASAETVTAETVTTVTAVTLFNRV